MKINDIDLEVIYLGKEGALWKVLDANPGWVWSRLRNEWIFDPRPKFHYRGSTLVEYATNRNLKMVRYDDIRNKWIECPNSASKLKGPYENYREEVEESRESVKYAENVLKDLLTASYESGRYDILDGGERIALPTKVVERLVKDSLRL